MNGQWKKRGWGEARDKKKKKKDCPFILVYERSPYREWHNSSVTSSNDQDNLLEQVAWAFATQRQDLPVNKVSFIGLYGCHSILAYWLDIKLPQ